MREEGGKGERWWSKGDRVQWNDQFIGEIHMEASKRVFDVV